MSKLQFHAVDRAPSLDCSVQTRLRPVSDIRPLSGSSLSGPASGSAVLGSSGSDLARTEDRSPDERGATGSSRRSPEDGPRTVVNPERRRQHSPLVVGDNSLLRRLFPTDSEYRTGVSPDPTGLTLDHFEIIERIGSGGMSAVFKARDNRLDRLVALKVLAPEQSRDPEAVQRFTNEARAAARLDHPNIVKSFHVGVTDGVHFIAYEFVEGENLRDHVRRNGRPTVRESVNITIQIALALQHAETLGIVHRDIKPSNIVVNDRRQAKLIDLGLARQPAAPGEELTIAGTTLGTFDYVSPEQARDPRSVDVRSDVYSLGCTLYFALTGQPPYPEGTMLQKLLDHQAKQPPNPAASNPRVPPSLASLCQRMMASNPRRRPPNAEALLRELAAVAAELGLQATQPDGLVWGVPQPRSSFWEKHLGWMTTVGLLVAIVVVLERFPRSVTPAPTPEPRDRGDLVANDGTGDDRTTDGGDGRVDPLPTRTDDPQEARGVETPLEGVTDTVRPREERGAEPMPMDDSGTGTEIARTGSDPSDDSGDSVKVTSPVAPGESTVDDSATSDGPAVSIVSKAGGLPRSFGSLSAAVAAAEDGDVVELAYDGVHDEMPFRVVGKSITIRAANGFRPAIRFSHEDVPSEEGTIRMISVSRGAVDLVNLDVRLTIDDVVVTSGRRWALFAVHGDDRVEIRNTRITVSNPAGRDVAVVDLLPDEDRPVGVGTITMMKPGLGDSGRSDVRFANTLVRGEANIVVVERTRPVRLDFEQSVFAVDRSVVHVLGGNRPAVESDGVDVRVAHTTAVVGNGFLRFESGSGFPRYLPTVTVSARNNILATRTDVPLVEARGSTDLQDFRELLRWTGDTNFYDGFRVFWATPPMQTLAVQKDVDFETWRTLWGSTGMYGSVTWVTAPTASGYERLEPHDLALDPEAPTNRAVSGATDGTDAGADLTSIGPAERS